VFTLLNLNNNKMEKISVGSKIPSFELKNQNGELFNISTVLGKKNLVVYFYPKDDTPVCTKEACAFRDQYAVFEDAEAIIIGISAQSVESHFKFAKKHNLNFTLLSDKGNKIRKLFGVPSNFLGLIAGRVTYVINKEGKVVYLFNSQMEAEKHVDEALRIIESIK
jgi:peroxiredoxin Q/BCP